MIRYSDVPSLVSLDFLRKLDESPPGTYLSQPKIDGRRRMIYHTPTGWQYIAKNRDDCKPLPSELRSAFESLPWPPGIGLDCEWSGPRHVNGKHELWIFDLLALDGKWAGDMTHIRRGNTLIEIMRSIGVGGVSHKEPIHIVQWFANPGLVDRFTEQMQNPLSEGLVVRRADSKIIGNANRCAVNPLVFKIKYREAKKENP